VSVAKATQLGLLSLCALGINGMVGVGIFFVPASIAALIPGTAGIWVYALTVLAIAPVAVCYALLGARFSRDGGPYVWAQAAFGERVGFAVGWISYVSAVFSTAAVVSGLGQYLGPYLGFVGVSAAQLFAVLATLVLGGLVACGLRLSAWLWNSLTLAKLVPLFGLLALAVAAYFHTTPSLPSTPSHAPSAAPAGASVWLRAVLLALFATQGFEIMPLPAASIRRRQRTLPVAMAVALSFVMLLYMGLHFAAVRAVPELSASSAPLVDAAGALGGARMGYAVALGTQVSALGIAFGMFAMTPRYLAALSSSDGLGSWVGRESRRQVPLAALLVTLGLCLLLVLGGGLDSLFVLASMAVLAQFSVSVLALGALAWRRSHGLSRRHLGVAAPALIPLALVGLGAERRELIALSAALALGWALRYLQRKLTARARR